MQTSQNNSGALALGVLGLGLGGAALERRSQNGDYRRASTAASGKASGESPTGGRGVSLARRKKQTAIRSERSASGSDKASSGEGQARGRA